MNEAKASKARDSPNADAKQTSAVAQAKKAVHAYNRHYGQRAQPAAAARADDEESAPDSDVDREPVRAAPDQPATPPTGDEELAPVNVEERNTV